MEAESSPWVDRSGEGCGWGWLRLRFVPLPWIRTPAPTRDETVLQLLQQEGIHGHQLWGGRGHNIRKSIIINHRDIWSQIKKRADRKLKFAWYDYTYIVIGYNTCAFSWFGLPRFFLFFLSRSKFGKLQENLFFLVFLNICFCYTLSNFSLDISYMQ